MTANQHHAIAEPSTGQLAAAELDARSCWAFARLGEVVNAGRAMGWLSGELVEDVASSREAQAAYEAVPGATPMRTLAVRLDLSRVELDVLWLLVSIELSPLLTHAARLVLSPGMHQLNVQVLEQMASGPQGIVDDQTLDRLVRLGLIETTFEAQVPLSRRTIRPTDRVLALARGRFGLDRELGEIATLVPHESVTEPETHPPGELRQAMAAAADVLVVAVGNEGSGRRTLLQQVVASVARTALVVRMKKLSRESERCTRQLRAIARECRLHEAWPLLLEIEDLAERAELVESELLSSIAGPALATSRETCTWQVARPILTVPVSLPGLDERTVMWHRSLGRAPDEVSRACASRYSISPGLLARTAAAANLLAVQAGKITVNHVHTALRGQLERQLVGLARRVEITQTWDDLVLPIDQFDLLIEMVARVRHRRQVIDLWGFGDKVGKGVGVAALLSGPPGTGKTMVAGLVARELGLDLYQVDLSRIVSKYIGETEKQLASLFEAAESGHAILLFDEADSLFGKRTEVRSSTDRYANLEVNYLLQRMEAFTGISLLTTNHETAIDKAFLRRLAFHIRIPMPDEMQRAQLWQCMIPDRASRAGDLDFAVLAKEFVMSGGYIKNATLRAAFLAADDRSEITNQHLLRAARLEYESMGKVMHEAVVR